MGNIEMRLNKKITLITGGGQGIGETIARLFAQNGAETIICDINEKRAKNVADKINQNGGVAISFKTDVACVEEVEKLFGFIKKRYGRLDILVNNAGISPKQKFEEITEDDWDKVLNVNLKGCFLCSKQAFEIMKKIQSGRIINMSSAAGQMGGYASSVHYAASKAGILGFTKALARVGGPYNITVNAIAPGKILTDLYYKDVNPKINEQIIKEIPLGHPGKPEDVAETALFLASDAAKYISGECISVSGGWIRI